MSGTKLLMKNIFFYVTKTCFHQALDNYSLSKFWITQYKKIFRDFKCRYVPSFLPQMEGGGVVASCQQTLCEKVGIFKNAGRSRNIEKTSQKL